MVFYLISARTEHPDAREACDEPSLAQERKRNVPFRAIPEHSVRRNHRNLPCKL